MKKEYIKKKEEGEEGDEGGNANNNNNNYNNEQVFRFDKNFTDVSVKLITLTYIPANISFQFCSIVSVRSIKIMKNNHRRRNRDKWWTSLRRTIQENAFSLSCNVVFGYTETTTIHDGLFPLSLFPSFIIIIIIIIIIINIYLLFNNYPRISFLFY